jgi:hypothetical protein
VLLAFTLPKRQRGAAPRYQKEEFDCSSGEVAKIDDLVDVTKPIGAITIAQPSNTITSEKYMLTRKWFCKEAGLQR